MLNPFRCSSSPIDTSFQRQRFTIIHTTEKMSNGFVSIQTAFGGANILNSLEELGITFGEEKVKGWKLWSYSRNRNVCRIFRHNKDLRFSKVSPIGVTATLAALMFTLSSWATGEVFCMDYFKVKPVHIYSKSLIMLTNLPKEEQNLLMEQCLGSFLTDILIS